MGKQPSHKKQRQAALAKASGLKLLRYGGLGGLILIALAALISWRNADGMPGEETAVLTAPLLDGPADAPVKVVEYADLTCSACRQWHNLGIKEQLRADFGDQVSFEYRHFPVITAASPRWTEAAQCAAEQALFWPSHDYVYENLEPYPLRLCQRTGGIQRGVLPGARPRYAVFGMVHYFPNDLYSPMLFLRQAQDKA